MHKEQYKCMQNRLCIIYKLSKKTIKNWTRIQETV